MEENKPKKELKIVHAGVNSNMYKIVYEGGGEVPNMLKGMWTSPLFAQGAINGYLNGKKA